MGKWTSGVHSCEVAATRSQRFRSNAAMSPTPRTPMPFLRPFTNRDVSAGGYTDMVLRGWLARGEVRLLAKGLYAPIDLARDPHIRALWSSRAVADGTSAVSASAAAGIYGLASPTRLHGWATRSIPLTSLPDEHRREHGGLVVPSLEWTALTIARGQRLPQALIVLDSAIRAGASRDGLLAQVERMARWPGVAHLATAIAHMNPLSESALESVSRGVFIEAGLPTPVLQHRIRAEGATYFADFFWPAFSVIGEADGMSKYERDERGAVHAIGAEKRRQAVLERVGYRVVRWMWSDVEPDPRSLISRLRSVLVAAE